MTQAPRGIVVCVGFDDLLALTLRKNMRFLSECVVVTSPQDVKTQALVRRIPDCRLHVTDAFYRHGAKFNKGLALEEGFDVLGRDGWILIWDADILFPDHWMLPSLQKGTLYGARRLVLKDPTKWTPDLDWNTLRQANDADRCSGYFQLFHADDHHVTQRPWYDVCFTHAGGGDGYFDSRWPRTSTRRVHFLVLHMGPVDANWFGRVQPRIDGQRIDVDSDEARHLNAQYRAYKGWTSDHDVRPETFVEVIEVPGHAPSGFVPRPGRIRRPT